MKIYLIRHGKSSADDNLKRQGPETPLSEEGIIQAEALGKRLQKINIDVFLSSNWARAKETAEIVAKHIPTPLEILETIHEKTMHPDVEYSEVESEMNKIYMEELHAHYEDINWKFRGEGESIVEVIQRATQFRNYLLDRYKNKDILVITHGIFLFCFIMACLLDKDYDETMLMKLLVSLTYDNASISMVEYKEEKGKWKLRYFNDTNHLKDMWVL